MATHNDTYRLPLSITLPEVLSRILLPLQGSLRAVCSGTDSPDYMHVIDSGFRRIPGLFGKREQPFFTGLGSPRTLGFIVDTVGSASGPYDETTYSASVATSAAVQWIATQPGPFFASMCFNAPHTPFEVPPLGLLSATTQAEVLSLGYAPGQNLTDTPDAQRAFDWNIEAVDHEIGRLLAGISPTKLAKTLVIVISDNGTPRGVVQDPPLNKDHAKGTVYELGTRVPLLISGPLVQQQNSDAYGLVSATDVWRTIADATGAKLPATGGEEA
jgi:hypothetical protein